MGPMGGSMCAFSMANVFYFSSEDDDAPLKTSRCPSSPLFSLCIRNTLPGLLFALAPVGKLDIELLPDSGCIYMNSSARM